MQEGPLVSVILPVYKVEPYIRRCLDSLAGQTYKNLEIILSDDGSPDKSGAVCDEYAARDSRFRVIHSENGGISAARNRALAIARGEWLAFVDPDDWVEPDYIEYLLSGALGRGADIAVCGRFEEEPRRSAAFGVEEEMLLGREDALALLVRDSEVRNYMWDKLWRRGLFDGVLFPEGRTFEDIAVSFILFDRAEKVLLRPAPKYHYRINPDGVVADVSLANRIWYARAVQERCRRFSGRYPQFADALSGGCLSSCIPVWTCYMKNSPAERRRFAGEIAELSAYVRSHRKDIGSCEGIGAAGRIVLRLAAHDRWWAFALSRLVGELYFIKHGRYL